MRVESGTGRIERQSTPIKRALAELTSSIRERWPEAQLEVFRGEDPDGIYLRIIVDIPDPDEVTDAISDRLLQMQVDEGLPIYAIAVRPLARIMEEQHRQLTTGNWQPITDY